MTQMTWLERMVSLYRQNFKLQIIYVPHEKSFIGEVIDDDYNLIINDSGVTFDELLGKLEAKAEVYLANKF